MDAVDPSRETAKLHVSTLLVASERALVNALDELGFAENDDRIIEHEGRFAFITCSHDADCDDLFALISELAARGETWELQFRIDTAEGRAIFQRFARHQPVEAVDAAVPPDPSPPTGDLPVHDLEERQGRAAPSPRPSTASILPRSSSIWASELRKGRATATVHPAQSARRDRPGGRRRRSQPAHRVAQAFVDAVRLGDRQRGTSATG